MVDAKQVTTADELLALPDDGERRELVQGELRRMSPAGGRHGRLAARLTARLHAFVEQADLGTVLTSDPGFRLSSDPDTVRAPDVAFIARPRSAAVADEPGFLPGAPDLAVEILSPSDTFSAVEGKALCWIDAGARLVLVVDPGRRSVTAYRARDDVRVLADTEVIDGGDVVPGWRLSIVELFGV